MITSMENFFEKMSSGKLLANLFANGNFLVYPFNNWVENKSASGTNGNGCTFQFVSTGTASSGHSILFAATPFSHGTTNKFRINWDKPLFLSFNFVRLSSDAQCVGRIQVKEVQTEGALAAKGIGIRIDNYTVFAESFGTQLKTTEIFTADNDKSYQMDILIRPGVSIEYYVDKVLKAVHTTAADIPTGEGGNNGLLLQSIINGVTGGVDALLYLQQPKLWQGK